MHLVYIYMGKLPAYTISSLYQARLFTDDPIFLICDDENSELLEPIRRLNVTVVPCKYFNDQEFIETVNKNVSKFCIAEKLGDRRLLFIHSFQRFFVLKNFMKALNLENVLFLELDVLIYFKPSELTERLSQKETAFSYVQKKLMSSGIFYAKSGHTLESLTNFFLKFIETSGPDKFVSEMVALGEWIEDPENKKKTWLLPGIWKEDRYNPDTYENMEVFDNAIYDGCGLAISIVGPDLTHVDEWLQKGRVWWGADIQYHEYTYIWKFINGKRILHMRPSAESPHEYKINCLHVHNKDLDFFLSRPRPAEFQCYDFVHGDRFLKMADIVLRKKERSDYYEVKDWTNKKILFFEDIPSSWDNPKLIFMNTEDVKEFLNHIEKLQNPFVLLSHNSDTNITSEYIPLCENDKLIHWFTQNPYIQHPKISFLPIGLANPIWPHGNYPIFSIVQSFAQMKNLTYYANFLIETNRTAREYCLDILQKKGIPYFAKSPPLQYLMQLKKSIFCICPEGNGVDTHRLWETLYMGSVPVLLKNSFTERISKDYPCILLDKWEDLDINPLGNPETVKILEMASAKQQEIYNKLKFSYFQKQILDACK